MDNLQAALDAPTALNVTVQVTRRRGVRARLVEARLQRSLSSSAQVCGQRPPGGTPRINEPLLARSRPSLFLHNGSPSPTSCACYGRTIQVYSKDVPIARC